MSSSRSNSSATGAPDTPTYWNTSCHASCVMASQAKKYSDCSWRTQRTCFQGGISMARILIVGESWVTNATHYKGFDQFTSTTFESGVAPLKDALESGGHEVRWMPAH